MGRTPTGNISIKTNKTLPVIQHFHFNSSTSEQPQHLSSCYSYSYCTSTAAQLPRYTQCPSVNRVTASNRPLNDSAVCPSSLLKLLTVFGFIIDETLSAGYSNMQHLQTSVKMNTRLSRCRLPPLAAVVKPRNRQEYFICLSVSAPHCAWRRWHLIIVLMSPWLNLWPRALSADALQTPQGTSQASPLAPRRQTAAEISRSLITFFRLDRPF